MYKLILFARLCEMHILYKINFQSELLHAWLGHFTVGHLAGGGGGGDCTVVDPEFFLKFYQFSGSKLIN